MLDNRAASVVKFKMVYKVMRVLCLPWRRAFSSFAVFIDKLLRLCEGERTRGEGFHFLCIIGCSGIFEEEER